jgi:hypothetical protein
MIRRSRCRATLFAFACAASFGQPAAVAPKPGPIEGSVLSTLDRKEVTLAEDAQAEVVLRADLP